MGQFTKMHKKLSYLDHKSFAKIYQPIRYFNYGILVIATIVTSLALIQLLLQEGFSENIFTQVIINTIKSKKILEPVIALLITCCSCIPFNCIAVMDLVVHLSSNFIIWDVNILPVNPDLNNSQVLKSLSQINHAFISKSAIMSMQLKRVCVLKFLSNRIGSTSKIYENLHNLSKEQK